MTKLQNQFLMKEQTIRSTTWGHHFIFLNCLLAILTGFTYVYGAPQTESFISFLYLIATWLGQISFDGKVTKLWSQSHDLEGVTIHPETGDLYIACEPNSVVRIKAPEYAKPTTWDTVITVRDAKSYGNSGMEGISYYKDDILFVGTQTGANVWLYTIDGKLMVRRDGKIVEYKEGDSGPRYVSLQKIHDDIKEVGGLCYDQVNDWLWVSD